jgi:HlyD family secretion protein
LKKDTDYYEWSRKLAAEKYLSSTQLQADELSMKQSEYSLKVAQNSLRLLEEYNSQRQLKQLESDVNQAAAALGRAKAKAHANIVQGEALLAARAQELEHQKEMLARHEEEVRGSKVYAPVDGTVIYATSRGGGFHDERKPLADGVDVWERQELIYLQKSSSTIAEVGLHEVNLQKVRVGMPAVVSVDALPGRKLMGTITRIAPLADSQSMWMNPDLKIYKTEITLDVNDPELRSGMNCRAEIVVEQHADAIYVPVQSVRRVAGQPTVYVLHDDGQVEERKIEIGWDDNRMVRVIRGLAQDEPVLLTPPGKAGPEPGLHRTIRGADANDMMQQIREKLQAANGPAPGVRRPQGSGPGPLRTQ